MSHKFLKILILLVVLIIGCLFFTGGNKKTSRLINYISSSEAESTVQFYYWKNSFKVDEEMRGKVKELECNRVYLHYFDVIWRDQRPVPIAQLTPVKSNPLYADSVRMVPVVFITNEVFVNSDGEQIKDLVYRVKYLIDDIATYNDTLGVYDEIQIDCDWTQSTKDIYFAFLDSLAKSSQKNISCTIRLHQIKDAKQMGVPPVKKGCLMCYATTDPTDGARTNSILDINLLKNYTKNLDDYPLPLTYALPLFSWGIVKNHEGRYKLINGISRELLETENFSHKEGNFYTAVNDCFLNGFYMSKGFTIELEEISPDLLRQARQYLKDKVGDHTVVYFHLSKGYLNRFSITDLK